MELHFLVSQVRLPDWDFCSAAMACLLFTFLLLQGFGRSLQDAFNRIGFVAVLKRTGAGVKKLNPCIHGEGRCRCR